MPDYYIWTENKSLTIDSVDVSCTILKYQTTANKKIAGIDISFNFLTDNSNNPIFNISDQSTANGWDNAGEVHDPTNSDTSANWPIQAIKTSEFKIVMAGHINQALDSQGQHGTLANFRNTTFAVADVQIADGSANLVSASDISLAEPAITNTDVTQTVVLPANEFRWVHFYVDITGLTLNPDETNSSHFTFDEAAFNNVIFKSSSQTSTFFFQSPETFLWFPNISLKNGEHYNIKNPHSSDLQLSIQRPLTSQSISFTVDATLSGFNWIGIIKETPQDLPNSGLATGVFDVFDAISANVKSDVPANTIIGTFKSQEITTTIFKDFGIFPSITVTRSTGYILKLNTEFFTSDFTIQISR